MSSGNKVSLCSILSNSCFDYYKYSGVKKQIFFSVGEYHVWPRKHSGTEHAGFLAPTKKKKIKVLHLRCFQMYFPIELRNREGNSIGKSLFSTTSLLPQIFFFFLVYLF